MARENKTKYAVLGLLSWQPMSGYDVKRAYEGSLGHFWGASYGQIYPILKELAADGLATSTTEREGGRPERNVFQITEAGRQALLAWLAQPLDPARPRLEVLVRLLHGFQAPPATSAAQVERYRAEQRAMLETVADTRRGIEARRGGEFDRAVPFWLLTVRYGELTALAALEWCDEAIRVLDRLEGEAPTAEALASKTTSKEA
jgi:PadR family transcriptional regulator, regulatory protein AphA